MASNSTREWNSAGTSSSGSARYRAGPKFTYIPQELVRIIEPVMKALSKTTNPDIVQEVSELIATIMELVSQLSGPNFELSNLPPLYGANLENGSFLIEWLSPNYRVGLLVDPDPKESIWYLIEKSKSSDSNLSGSLTSSERKAALTQLVSFVALNS